MQASNTTEATAKRRRSGGRRGRVEKRSRGPAERPIRPGMEGGRYKPLSDRETEQIHETSLELLEKVGIADPIDAWRDRVVAAGGWMDSEKRLHFPRALVEDCLALAGRNFTACGRDPKYDLDVSGTRVHFGGGSATVEILDAFTNRYRETQLLDLYDNTRLEDCLDGTKKACRWK